METHIHRLEVNGDVATTIYLDKSFKSREEEVSQ